MNLIYFILLLIVLLGFKYLASSIPLICLTGVAIGVGMLFAFLIISISRNPSISNSLIRWAFIGFSLVEVSGFIGLVYSFLILYALLYIPLLISVILLFTGDNWFPFWVAMLLLMSLLKHESIVVIATVCLIKRPNVNVKSIFRVLSCAKLRYFW